MNEPRRRLDPLALAVHAVALALLAGGIVYFVATFKREARQTVPPPVAKEGLPAAKAPVLAKEAAPAAMGRPAPLRPEAGRVWRYRVSVEPPLWRDATLLYRTSAAGKSLAVDTEFRYAGGQLDFHLGTFAPSHASHANMRFPGFFMHAAYLDRPLEIGQRFSWQWPWQLPGGQTRDGRIKRYVGEVRAWENAATAVGVYSAARIEAKLDYIEGGRIQASAVETFWYAPKVFQVMKVVREGKTPDEGAHRIVAELVEFK